MRLSLETVFGLIIGAVFVVIIGFVIVALIRSLLPREIDDATLSGFDEIVSAIKSFEIKGGTKSIIVDINKPFVIVGFDKDESIKRDNLISGAHIKRLANPCPGKSCLCICPSTSKSIKERIFGSTVDYSLKDNDCFTYKEKCMEFDGNLKGALKGTMGDDLVLRPWDKLHEISITVDKDVIEIDDVTLKKLSEESLLV